MGSKNEKKAPDDSGQGYIFVASFFHKGLGRRVFAREYGLKAFKIKTK